MTIPTADSFLLGAGGASAKFENVGDTVTGTVVSTEVTNQTDLQSGAVLTWDDGSPRQQLVVTLQTQEKSDADDDGVRKVYVKGSKKPGSRSLHDAVASAVRAAGAKGLTPGGTLTVKYIGDEPSATRGFNPRKLYEANFVPSAGGEFLGTTTTAAPAQQPAPPVTPTPAPAPAATTAAQPPAQAAPAAAPAGMSEEQAAAFAAFQNWQAGNGGAQA